MGEFEEEDITGKDFGEPACCHMPSPPSHASPARPGSKFRRGRCYKQDADECLSESAVTTAPSSRSVSIDSAYTSVSVGSMERQISNEDPLLPTLSEPTQSPHS